MREQMQPGGAISRASPIILTRRQLLRTAFWSAALGGVGGGALHVCRYLRAPVAGRVVYVLPELLPAVDAPPLYVPTGRFYVVHLRAGEPLDGGRYQPPGETPGGFLVLSARDSWTLCKVRGIEWVRSFRVMGLDGALMDPCRHAAFNRAGLPVYGPAFRPLDTLHASFDRAGGLLVDTGTVQPGGADDPVRTIRP